MQQPTTPLKAIGKRKAPHPEPALTPRQTIEPLSYLRILDLLAELGGM